MGKRIVIAGAGTGGTPLANRLCRRLSRDAAEIIVVDRDDDHVYPPGLLFLPFDLADANGLVRSRRERLNDSITFRQSGIDRVDVTANEVRLVDGAVLGYDVLVVATGAAPATGVAEGLAGPAWGATVSSFYTLGDALDLRSMLARFDAGRLVVNVVDMPISCPVAPLAFCFVADWHFRRLGVRDRVEITYVTPLDAAFARPVAAGTLGGLFTDKGVSLVPEFTTVSVEAVSGRPGRLVSYDGRDVPFDLAVVIPAHSGADYVDRSPGLGDDRGFVPVDAHTLQAKAAPNVFAIGDAAAVPASMAGSAARFEGEVLAGNIERFLTGRPLDDVFDGHTNGYAGTGFGAAQMIGVDDETEPLSGHHLGPAGLPPLERSPLNYRARQLFQWLYWRVLLPSRDLPGLGAAMPARRHI